MAIKYIRIKLTSLDLLPSNSVLLLNFCYIAIFSIMSDSIIIYNTIHLKFSATLPWDVMCLTISLQINLKETYDFQLMPQ